MQDSLFWTSITSVRDTNISVIKIIVDPCAGVSVKDLQKGLGAKLITTPLEDLTLEEFS